MPITRCTLPDGSGEGWRWGDHGACYRDRADAERQAAAAHANGYAGDIFALDRASVREIDQDGHLHVAESPISKACVNPNHGREIPGWQELGLDPDRIYRLLRDPAELEKAAGTFDGKPLLNLHRPQTAEDHDKGLTVGAVNNVRWQAPYLMGRLDVWDGDAIDGIKSGDQRQLSSAYRYRPDMTAGTFDGQPYDGVMRDIAGNHVALVPKGRAGPDVVVGDQALSTEKGPRHMATKKVLSRRAAGAKSTLVSALRPLIATDAEISELVNLLDKLDGNDPDGNDPDGDDGAAAQDGDAEAQVRAILGDKVSPEEVAKVLALIKPAAEDDAPAKPMVPGQPAPLPAKTAKDETQTVKDNDGKEDVNKETVTQAAMDAAIGAAVTAANSAALGRLQAINDAQDAVRPFIGSIKVNIAQDSAATVYRMALDHFKSEGHPVDLAGVPEAAFGSVFRSIAPIVQSAARRPAASLPMAADSAAVTGFAARFPGAKLAARI